MTEVEALEHAISYAGGQNELAKKVTDIALKIGALPKGRKIKQQHISNWKNREGRCPANMARPLSLVVDSTIPPSHFRPDLYPLESV